jgi:hypothetical protein
LQWATWTVTWARSMSCAGLAAKAGAHLAPVPDRAVPCQPAAHGLPAFAVTGRSQPAAAIPVLHTLSWACICFRSSCHIRAKRSLFPSRLPPPASAEDWEARDSSTWGAGDCSAKSKLAKLRARAGAPACSCKGRPSPAASGDIPSPMGLSHPAPLPLVSTTGAAAATAKAVAA